MSAGGGRGRYPNGQPVGYSNRGLCEKCAGDLGDCNCPPPPADAALLRECADGYECAAAVLHDAGAVATLYTRAARLRALAREQERINVGLLRATACKVAARFAERLSAGEAAEVLGMVPCAPATDLAEAIQQILDVAQVRVTRDEETGVLTFHDLLVLSELSPQAEGGR